MISDQNACGIFQCNNHALFSSFELKALARAVSRPSLCFSSGTHALLYVQVFTSADKEASSTIVYATVGRAQYAFDVYSQHLQPNAAQQHESRLTDGVSVNFNGAFGRCLTAHCGLDPARAKFLHPVMSHMLL